MAKLENFQKVAATLKFKAKEVENVSVIVGYTASYSVYVHENLAATHTNGQAKFLEEPARTMAKELGQIVKDAMAKGVSMGKALLMAGLRLQRESQLLCPVDTGNMKASAFTRME